MYYCIFYFVIRKRRHLLDMHDAYIHTHTIVCIKLSTSNIKPKRVGNSAKCQSTPEFQRIYNRYIHGAYIEGFRFCLLYHPFYFEFQTFMRWLDFAIDVMVIICLLSDTNLCFQAITLRFGKNVRIEWKSSFVIKIANRLFKRTAMVLLMKTYGVLPFISHSIRLYAYGVYVFITAHLLIKTKKQFTYVNSQSTSS